MSICGYHSPRFSEDIAWLPQWLQPYGTPTVGDHRNNATAASSPSCQNCAFVGHPSQERQDCQNATGGYSGFTLHLSGDEDTAASSPVSSNVLPFSLRLSSESVAQPSLAEGNDNPQMPNSGTCKGPSEGLCADAQEQEVNVVSQNQFEANKPQAYMLTEMTCKEISKQLDSNRHKRHDVYGGKVDVRKLRNADVNDAIELSIAASEAMVIAEAILDSQSDKSAAAAIEAALHVKEARKQFYFEEPEHAWGSSKDGLDETDWLAELDESEMIDVYQDVGVSLVHIACSYQDQNTGNLKQQNSHPSPPCDADTHILWDSSSERQNKKWNSQNADSDDHVSDSFPNNQSADVLPNEPTPCSDSIKQATLCKTISCSRKKETGLQASTQNNAALHGTLGAPATYQNVHKEVAGVAAQMNIGIKKRVKGLFEEENSYISESISMDKCCPTSRASSMEIIASSRESFYCKKAEGFLEVNHCAETEELCCQIVCSSLSQVDPLCSFVPCSISCDEGPSSQAPVCKQREGHEGPSSQAPLCKKSEGPTCLTPERGHSKGEEKEFMHTKEFPMMQYLDGEAGPSRVPLVKPAYSNVSSRQRKYSSLRPFSTIATKSNTLGSPSNCNAGVPVCQLERFTPVILNKNVQRVQAAKEFTENSAGAENLQDFSAVQKQTYHSQDDSEDQIREIQVPREVFPSTENLVCKQHLKRKRVQFSEAKLSSRRTKSNRRTLTKSRFSQKLETREYTDNKEATFQGVEFLLTGFPNLKEKEIESLIRKSGGYVLSKLPPFPLDKRKNMAEFPSWKPPIVLSPKKVSTTKFLYGCAIDAWILNPNWIFDCLQAGVMLPPGK